MESKAGLNRYAWLGLDSRGEEVSPSVYFYRIRADGMGKTGKMVKVDMLTFEYQEKY